MARPHRRLPQFSAQQQSYFWSQVDQRHQDECWEWKSDRFKDGYGKIHFVTQAADETYVASRVAYFLHYLADPGHLLVCHRCDNPPCCNPHHMFLGTHLTNAQDRDRKGRRAKGDQVPPEKRKRGSAHDKAKLTEEDVINIRKEYDAKQASQRALARCYGVRLFSIQGIVKRLTWKHI